MLMVTSSFILEQINLNTPCSLALLSNTRSKQQNNYPIFIINKEFVLINNIEIAPLMCWLIIRQQIFKHDIQVK